MKYKNYGFWTSLGASAVVVAGVLQKAFGFEISSEILTDIIMGIAGVLVVFGVIKMPKIKNEESQAKKKDDEVVKKDLGFEVDEIKKVESETTRSEEDK